MLLCVSNFFILFYFFLIFINTFRQNFEPRRFRSKLGYHAIIEFIHWMQLKLIKFIFPNSTGMEINVFFSMVRQRIWWFEKISARVYDVFIVYAY